MKVPRKLDLPSDIASSSPIKIGKKFSTLRKEITTSIDDIDNELSYLLYKLCSDKNGNNFRNMDDDFNLYISIAKNANNSLPDEVIKNKLFKKYRVSKKNFPRKSYYQLN